MKKLLLLSSIAVSSALLLTACSKNEESSNSTSTSSSTSTTQGEKKATTAFNFTAMDKDGKEVKLSDFAGKKVYINTWASWCGPCIKEIPELEKTYQKLKDKGDIVFLSMTSPSDSEFKNQNPADKGKDVILQKASELGITYPVLFDVNDRFLVNYAIRSFPTHIFINSDGTIGKTVVGMMNEDSLEKELNSLT